MLQTHQILQGRYRIVKMLGQGGMGAVYQAYEVTLNVPCVIKEMLPPDNPAEVKPLAAQFLREAKALAGLRHANLPRVTHYFVENGNYYLVMDLVEGQSLDKLIRSGGLPEAVVLGYADQLLGVLQYIHGRGILHRDIKPANIIVQPDGRVMLVDFGLTKAMNSGQSSIVSVRGLTPQYAPPEQYTGGTDERSDLYSLAATLYQALTGVSPASATDRSAGTRQATLRQSRAAISTQTDRVIMKALNLDRNARYQSASAMQLELARDSKKPLSISINRASPGTRVPWLAILIGCAAIVMAGGLLLLVSQLQQVEAPAPTHTPAPRATTSLQATATLAATQSPAPSATAAPSLTPVPAPTQTPAPSATTAPSTTPIPEPTQSPTPGSTPTRAGTPIQPAGTRTPLPPSAEYPAPALLSPASGSRFVLPDIPLLAWQSVDNLGPDDYYLVQIDHAQGVDPYYVKTTTVMAHDYLPGLRRQIPFTWRVSVVRKTADGYVPISPASGNWEFTWEPNQSQGGGGGSGSGSPKWTPIP